MHQSRGCRRREPETYRPGPARWSSTSSYTEPGVPGGRFWSRLFLLLATRGSRAGRRRGRGGLLPWLGCEPSPFLNAAPSAQPGLPGDHSRETSLGGGQLHTEGNQQVWTRGQSTSCYVTLHAPPITLSVCAMCWALRAKWRSCRGEASRSISPRSVLRQPMYARWAAVHYDNRCMPGGLRYTMTRVT